MLFFLQPIVRGWARFKWRLTLSGRKPAQVELPAVAAGGELPDTITYWSDGRVDRFKFLEGILAKLGRAGWMYRTDTGWTYHDVEVLPHVWTRIRLTTVSEDLEQGKKSFRCRINANWSLPAKILVTLTILGVVLVLPSLVEPYPWAWMTLVVFPLIIWVVEDEAIQQAKTLAGLVKAAATEHSMVEVS